MDRYSLDRLALCSPLIAMGFLFRQAPCFRELAISVCDRGLKCQLLNLRCSECSVILLFLSLCFSLTNNSGINN